MVARAAFTKFRDDLVSKPELKAHELWQLLISGVNWLTSPPCPIWPHPTRTGPYAARPHPTHCMLYCMHPNAPHRPGVEGTASGTTASRACPAAGAASRTGEEREEEEEGPST